MIFCLVAVDSLFAVTSIDTQIHIHIKAKRNKPKQQLLSDMCSKAHESIKSTPGLYKFNQIFHIGDITGVFVYFLIY